MWPTSNGSGDRTLRVVRPVLLLLFLCIGVGGFGFPTAGPSSRRHRSALLTPSKTQLLAAPAAESSNNDEGIRLNKVFKATHSRRQADGLIADGRVTVNDVPEPTAGRRVVPGDVVRLDGNVIRGWEALNHVAPSSSSGEGGTERKSPYEYIKYWKGRGVTCTTDRSIRSNIMDALEYDGYRPRNRVYPVGRLDRDTSGLILLTSDGRLPNSALRGQHKQPKTYEVLLDHPITDGKIQTLRDGVVITTQAQRDGRKKPPLTARTKPCEVERIGGGRRKLRVTLVEGRNRQIRKMAEAVGLNAVGLHRIEFMRMRMAPLRGPGDWAPLSREEVGMVRNVIDKAEREKEAPR